VFGELITLIEDNKRSGEKEELKIILPYSAQSFSVPRNLFILGTMNTADRSVEALDTALRRRFSFEQLAARPELLSPQRLVWQLWWDFQSVPWLDPDFVVKETALYVFLKADGLSAMDEEQKEALWQQMHLQHADHSIFDQFSFSGLNLQTLLKTINQRIEKLLSCDHAIGHSYFMSVYTLEDLMNVLYDRVIPLLQEYFHGDLAKIGLILGNGFVQTRNAEAQGVFADFDYNLDHLNEKEIFDILDYRQKTHFSIEVKNVTIEVSFQDAVALLLGKKTKPADE
jgi:5-methylcytosine-specific restriction protein B